MFIHEAIRNQIQHCPTPCLVRLELLLCPGLFGAPCVPQSRRHVPTNVSLKEFRNVATHHHCFIFNSDTFCRLVLQTCLPSDVLESSHVTGRTHSERSRCRESVADKPTFLFRFFSGSHIYVIEGWPERILATTARCLKFMSQFRDFTSYVAAVPVNTSTSIAMFVIKMFLWSSHSNG